MTFCLVQFVHGMLRHRVYRFTFEWTILRSIDVSLESTSRIVPSSAVLDFPLFLFTAANFIYSFFNLQLYALYSKNWRISFSFLLTSYTKLSFLLATVYNDKVRHFQVISFSVFKYSLVLMQLENRMQYVQYFKSLKAKICKKY